MEKLSLVVPVYNEEKCLRVFYERVEKVLEGIDLDYEIIFVNDGSKDNSLEELLRLRDLDPRVKIIDLSRNFGKEAALTAGLDYSSGDIVIPIDADLQDPPEVIPEMILKWREGYDVVYATRIERDGESWLKRLTAYLFYRVAGRIMPIAIPRDTGDFRLMTRRVVEVLKTMRESNRFMKGLFAWVGFPSTAVYYRRERRCAGKTKWNYWKLWNFALEGITSFSYLPLQVSTYLGFIVAVLAFLYAVVIVAKTLLLGRTVPGYASIMTVMLFMGGVQLMCIGVLGEYVGRIYHEVKRRPLYVVRQFLG
ncbi:MAG: glycosyltransferase family 2 protein [Thermoproteota archaeon]